MHRHCRMVAVCEDLRPHHRIHDGFSGNIEVADERVADPSCPALYVSRNAEAVGVT